MARVGVDMVEVARIERAISRWGERFLHRIYTGRELGLCHNRPTLLAARFAAKEAVAKALGVGIGAVRWRDIEVLRGESRQPIVQVQGKAEEEMQRLGLRQLAVSLSHTGKYAIALVVADEAHHR